MSTLTKHTKVSWRVQTPFNQDAILVSILKYEWESRESDDGNTDSTTVPRSFYLNLDGEWIEYKGFDVLSANSQLCISRPFMCSQPDVEIERVTEGIRAALQNAGFEIQRDGLTDGCVRGEEFVSVVGEIPTLEEVNEDYMASVHDDCRAQRQLDYEEAQRAYRGNPCDATFRFKERMFNRLYPNHPDGEGTF